MDWVDLMLHEAKKSGMSDGCLIEKHSVGDTHRVDYLPTDDYISLDGDFTVDELEALLTHMKDINGQ